MVFWWIVNSSVSPEPPAGEPGAALVPSLSRLLNALNASLLPRRPGALFPKRPTDPPVLVGLRAAPDLASSRLPMAFQPLAEPEKRTGWQS